MTLEAMNQAGFLTLNQLPSLYPQLLMGMKVIADYFIFIVPIVLVFMWFLSDDQHKEILIKANVVTFISLGVNQIIALYYQHPRPDLIGIGQTFIQHAQDSSFPSDHATVFFALGLGLMLNYYRKLGLGFLICGVFVGTCRVALGAHYPLDIVGAVMTVCTVYLIVDLLWAKLGKPISCVIIQLNNKLIAHIKIAMER